MTRTATDDLIAHWLPDAQFSEHHNGLIHGTPDDILNAFEEFDVSDDVLVRSMLALREAPSRLWGRLGGASNLTDKPRFGLTDFTLLERTPNAVAFGLCGKFWKLDFGLVDIDNPKAFQSLNTPGVARLAMVYVLEATDNPEIFNMVTETHIHCHDRAAYIRFLPYWLAIRLGSGFIRKRILARLKHQMQRDAA